MEKKPGGPTTPQGIAISSQNAVTHGMTSTLILIESETQADLDTHFAQWHLQYPTDNEIANRLVTRAALSEWRLLRLDRQFNTVSSQLLATPITGWTDANHALYKNIQRYLTTAQRAHHRDRLNIRQYRAELRSDELHEWRVASAKAGAQTCDPDSYHSEKLLAPLLKGHWPRIEGPLNQTITLKLDSKGEPWVNIVPSTQHLLSNTDNAFETTRITRSITLRDRPVAPGYEWVLDRLASAPPGQDTLVYHLTAKSFRIAAARENNGPIQPCDDLRALDKPILDSKVKGPPCQPRESS